MKKSKVLSIVLIFIAALTLVACKDNKKLDKLPYLEGRSKTEITEIFRKGSVDFEFVDFFVKDSTSIRFVSYGNDLNYGDSIPTDSKVIVNMSVDYLVLPNLADKTVDEMKTVFTDFGVALTDITFRPGVDPDVALGTFISYDSVKPGDYFTFKEKLVVLYDLSPGLPNLENLNKKELEKKLKELNIEKISYTYVQDNTKEYDLFAGYTTLKTGDKFDASEVLEIKLYSNNDVNVGDSIVAERQLFISKYIDGNELNQAIELYNPTANDINLVDYYIAILSNGKFKADDNISLSGVLKPNETFVIVKKGATDANLLAKANLITNDLNYDGNDVIQLRRVSNDTYIDAIYEVGNIHATLDSEVFIRREDVTAGNRNFKQGEWSGYIPTHTSVVGSHPVELALDPEFTEITEYTFQEFGMTQVQYTSAADGDTVYFNSLDPRDTTSYQSGKRIRFIMVDTPETEKPGQKGMPYAQVATSFTKTVMNAASKIFIQSDRSAGLTETYGRHLGYIWYYLDTPQTVSGINADNSDTTLEAGWHLLNYELIKYGLGERGLTKTSEYYKSITPGNRYTYQWALDAENYAIANKLGLFSGVYRD